MSSNSRRNWFQPLTAEDKAALQGRKPDRSPFWDAEGLEIIRTALIHDADEFYYKGTYFEAIDKGKYYLIRPTSCEFGTVSHIAKERL